MKNEQSHIEKSWQAEAVRANILLYNNLVISLVKIHKCFRYTVVDKKHLFSIATALHKKQLGYNSFDSTQGLGHNCGESTSAWLDPHAFFQKSKQVSIGPRQHSAWACAIFPKILGQKSINGRCCVSHTDCWPLRSATFELLILWNYVRQQCISPTFNLLNLATQFIVPIVIHILIEKVIITLFSYITFSSSS